MSPRATRKRATPSENIRSRLHEAEATLEAIRTGQVDALVVSGPRGERTLAIEGATHPYFVLLDAMSDGAALLETSGAILFANRTLAQIAGVPTESLRGAMSQSLVAADERADFEAFLREGAKKKTAREFSFATAKGRATPVAIGLSTLPLDANSVGSAPDSSEGPTVLMAIVTDLTYPKAVEATRARLLERLMSAEDDERRRIARELHDETGQSLTALLIGLRAIADLDARPEVQAALQRLRGIAAKTVDEVGRLARGLHPAVLDDMGLAAAATRYVGDHAKSLGVAVDLVVGDLDTPRLAPLAAATMYRILQETLTNVARHAHATKMTVELRRDASGLELTVHDDGVGFKTGRKQSEPAGLGLRGMRERVALLGGTIEIQSKPRKGTRVHVRIPSEVLQRGLQP